MLTPPEPTLVGRSSQFVPGVPSLGQNPDELTVVVFKDNLSSRTFRVPLRWISRLGTLVGILAVLAALSSLLATKYYRMARRGSPSRVAELEDELNGLRSSYSALQTKAAEDVKKATAAAAASAPKTALPLPQPTVTVTAAPPPAAAPVATARPAGMTAILFQDLPGNVVRSQPTAELPVKLSPPKVRWHNGSLQIQSALEYSRSDGGNQQGRIVVLARGPSTLLAYPDSVLNPGSSPVLIAPDHGESFSVSRYREINVDFGPIRATAALQEVEILIFGDPESAEAPIPLLIDEHVAVPAPIVEKPAPKSRKPQPKPPRKADDDASTTTGTPATTTGAIPGAGAANPESAPAPWPASPRTSAPSENGGSAPAAPAVPTPAPAAATPAAGEGTSQ